MFRRMLMVAGVVGAVTPAWAQQVDSSLEQVLIGSPAPADNFVVRVPGDATTVKVGKTDLTGPNIQVTRYGNTLRGRAGCAALEIDFTDQRVTGLFGGAPVDLHIRQSDAELEVQGLWAGDLAHLHISTAEIRGYIGRRDYALLPEAIGYVGLSIYGGNIALPAVVRVPNTVFERSTGELVAIMALLLGGGAAGPCDSEPVARWERVRVCDITPTEPLRVSARALLGKPMPRFANEAFPIQPPSFSSFGPPVLSAAPVAPSPVSFGGSGYASPANAYAGPAHGDQR